ncbi:27718_t:CDS:2, partial [Gigaspora margarita]
CNLQAREQSCKVALKTLNALKEKFFNSYVRGPQNELITLKAI